MFDEHEQPEELARLEKQLGELNPSPVVVDRDELMYRAGWAAAETHFVQGDQPNRSDQSAKSGNLVWPTVSAAFATLSAVLAVMVFQLSDSNIGSFVDPGASNQVVADEDRLLPIEPAFQTNLQIESDSMLASQSNPSIGSPSRARLFPAIYGRRQIELPEEKFDVGGFEIDSIQSPSTVGTLLNDLINNEGAL